MISTEQFTKIVSFSGMEHFVNPNPNYGNTKGLAIGRTQTMCRMHLRPEDAKDKTASCVCCEVVSKEIIAGDGPWLRFWGKPTK